LKKVAAFVTGIPDDSYWRQMYSLKEKYSDDDGLHDGLYVPGHGRKAGMINGNNLLQQYQA